MAYKQEFNGKKISLLILASLFAVFLIFSFSSIGNVYGADNEGLIGDEIDNSLADDLKETNVVQNTNSDSNEGTYTSTNSDSNTKSNDDDVGNGSNYDVPPQIDTPQSSQKTSNYGANSVDSGVIADKSFNSSGYGYVPNTDKSTCESCGMNPSEDTSDFQNPSYYSSDSNSFNLNYKENDSLLKGNNDAGNINDMVNIARAATEKIDEKSVKMNNIDIDFNNFYSATQYYEDDTTNSEDTNDNNNYLNNYNLVTLLSTSDFQGKGIHNFYNFIKEVSNFSLNNVNTKEDTSLLDLFDTGPTPTMTILFFITLFMEHHDNGKESQNSF